MPESGGNQTRSTCGSFQTTSVPAATSMRWFEAIRSFAVTNSFGSAAQEATAVTNAAITMQSAGHPFISPLRVSREAPSPDALVHPPSDHGSSSGPADRPQPHGLGALVLRERVDRVEAGACLRHLCVEHLELDAAAALEALADDARVLVGLLETLLAGLDALRGGRQHQRRLVDVL